MKTKLFFPTLLIAFFALGSIQYTAAQNCITPPSGMVAWLPGDANPQDILNNAMDVKAYGTVTFSPGMVGNAFTFNNSGDITYSTINAGNNYTIDFWVRPNSSGRDRGSRQNLIGNAIEGTTAFGIISLGFEQIEYGQNGGSSILDSKVRSHKIPFDTWTHVALTYDGQVNRLFINGTLVPNRPNGDNSVFGTSTVHNETFNNPISIGHAVGATNSSRFDGQIDEVEIFNRVLSQAEIQAIVNAGSAGKCKAPVDADGDGIVDGRDACPGTPPGTTVNAAGCPLNACFAPPAGLNHWMPGDNNPQDIRSNSDAVRVEGALTFAPGVVGQAFDFDGTDAVTYSNMNVGNAYTVDFWIRPTHSSADGQRQNLFGDVVNGTTTFGLITFGFQQIEYYQGSSERLRSPQIPFDAYTHVALTYDGTRNRLYLNGDLVATSFEHSETFNNRIALGDAIANVSGNARFHGQMDEVEIFNRALTQTEIRGIFNAATAGKCKTLVDADGDGVVDIRDACADTPAGTAVNAAGCPANACYPPPAGLTNWFRGNGNASDEKGGNTGTLNGVTFAEGKVGQAFSFNDTGGVSYSTINVGNAYSVDFWVRPTGDPGARREVISSPNSPQGFGIMTMAYNAIEYHQGSGFPKVSSPAGSVPQNTFTHVTLTYDGERNRLYINGNLVSTSPVHTETFNDPIKLGEFITYTGNSRFIGQLDEVEIFSRALTQTEIRGIVSADTAGKCELGNGVAPKTLGNISTRMPVLTGENVLIGGIIVTGNVPKRVIVRGLGPSLGALGVSGALADPVLELYQGNTLLFSNDNWQDSQGSEISATGVAPSHPLEAAIVRTLEPGNYTAILRGNGNITGVGLFDGYDLNQDPNSKLGNISTRGFVGTGDGALIAGFISGPNTRVVVRAIGPSLTNLGINGALQNPILELVDANGAVVRANDDWKTGQRAELEAIGIQPSDDRESALIEVLNAANYTAVVRGTNNTTGVAVVEVYNLQ